MLNKHISKELEAAYIYLDINNYFESNGLAGYGSYYKIKAKEEVDQAMMIYKYLQDNKAEIKLLVISENKHKISGVVDALKHGLQVEESISSSINQIYDLAISLKDYRTSTFLYYIIKEQMFKEKSAKQMLSDIEIFNDKSSLLFLNEKYGKKKYQKEN